MGHKLQKVESPRGGSIELGTKLTSCQGLLEKEEGATKEPGGVQCDPISMGLLSLHKDGEAQIA